MSGNMNPMGMFGGGGKGGGSSMNPFEGIDIGSPSRTTKTGTTVGAPQLMPEGAAGYNLAQQFFGGQVNTPGVYMGERFAPENEAQRGAYQQATDTMYNPWQTQGATNEFTRTLGGGWLEGPEAQRATAGLAQPIFERFENQTLPGIRDSSQMATGGMGGSRRTVADLNAVQELGYNLGQGAVAPIFNAERDRMTRQAIEGSTGITNQNIANTGALASIGEQQRNLDEMPVKARREPFEESLARQASGANALVSAATTGPGGSRAEYTPSDWRMILGSGKA